MSEQPGQGRPSEPGRLVRGRCLLGDRPDLAIDVSIRRAVEPFAEPLLEHARLMALHPVEGLAQVVDLSSNQLEGFVAYRWAEGHSLSALLAEGALSKERARGLLESLRTILERVARGP